MNNNEQKPQMQNLLYLRFIHGNINKKPKINIAKILKYYSNIIFFHKICLNITTKSETFTSNTQKAAKS